MSATGIIPININSSAPSADSNIPTPFIQGYSTDNTSENELSPEILTEPSQDVRIREHFVKQVNNRLTGEYVLLQQWEGYVIANDSNEIICRIVDKTNEENPEEEVSIPITELEPSEIILAKPGAVFYWSIRYADQFGRGRIRESLIRFRRLPPITKHKLEQSKKRAAYLEQFFLGTN